MGETLSSAGVRQRFDVTVVAVRRGDSVVRTRMGQLRLQPGAGRRVARLGRLSGARTARRESNDGGQRARARQLRSLEDSDRGGARRGRHRRDRPGLAADRRCTRSESRCSG
ncbi:TrkA C-terminal domain-containing protein [Halosolutus amylolyticus]|uniref:TrkA C-terminal domain-containing protein n=1 Tax=Halosolutus amylolyticus TaxID=2932267 RepID=A0ABD5PU27_9EURY